MTDNVDPAEIAVLVERLLGSLARPEEPADRALATTVARSILYNRNLRRQGKNTSGARRGLSRLLKRSPFTRDGLGVSAVGDGLAPSREDFK